MMVEKMTLHLTLFLFSFLELYTLKTKVISDIYPVVLGRPLFQEDMCQMANLRQAKYTGHVANLKEDAPAWFSAVLTAVLH